MVNLLKARDDLIDTLREDVAQLHEERRRTQDRVSQGEGQEGWVALGEGHLVEGQLG